MIEKLAQEQKQAEEKKKGEEINFLKGTNQQLKSQLEAIIFRRNRGTQIKILYEVDIDKD